MFNVDVWRPDVVLYMNFTLQCSHTESSIQLGPLPFSDKNCLSLYKFICPKTSIYLKKCCCPLYILICQYCSHAVWRYVFIFKE